MIRSNVRDLKLLKNRRCRDSSSASSFHRVAGPALSSTRVLKGSHLCMPVIVIESYSPSSQSERLLRRLCPLQCYRVQISFAHGASGLSA